MSIHTQRKIQIPEKRLSTHRLCSIKKGQERKLPRPLHISELQAALNQKRP